VSTIKELSAVFTEPELTLRYVNDSELPGISRVKKGKSFIYAYPNGESCNDEPTLKRIYSLVIPPAWTNVWICPLEDGHLQATGVDQLNRKQYKYHPLWNSLRNTNKFSKLKQFGMHLPEIRTKVKKDLAKQGLGKEKVMAIIVSVMEATCIRIGNECYEKLYGSYGLTTMRDKHVTIEGKKVSFHFKGKKGVYHEICCTEKKLADLVRKCKEIPGQELFQYYDTDGHRHTISSEDVNNYLKEITGKTFTAKDFRTWTGSVKALKALLNLGVYETKKECKQNIVKAIDEVSEKLGNTRTVCKKYYIHPVVIEMYEAGTLLDFLVNGKTKMINELLTPEENLLMNIIH
jgi:DNA topoisomerase-1